MTTKEPTVEGEWVDPTIPLPDHPIRKTAFWAVFNRLPRPTIWWVTVLLWVTLLVYYAFTNTPPDLGWFSALGGWTALIFGFTTYEKRLGIS